MPTSPFQQAVSELADKSNHLTTVSINAVLEIAVAHWTWSDQILKMIGQFHTMVGYDDRTSHQHILTKIQIRKDIGPVKNEKLFPALQWNTKPGHQTRTIHPK